MRLKVKVKKQAESKSPGNNFVLVPTKGIDLLSFKISNTNNITPYTTGGNAVKILMPRHCGTVNSQTG